MEKKSPLEKMEMKILIIGNLGYVGPVLMDYLIKKKYDFSGIDNYYFETTKVNNFLKKNKIKQKFLDVRDINEKDIKNFNVIIFLAAISNDPMGNKFKKQTNEINFSSVLKTAKIAKKLKINKFIFASSCSIYGKGGKTIKNERSKICPLTDYAKSKIECEKKLKRIATKKFKITCLRFATACGFSKNLRLDLVLNDFVASAILNKKIVLLSNGDSWRPLIHVKDMSRAIEWSIKKNFHKKFILLNIGNNSMNVKVISLAKLVSKKFSGCKVIINLGAKSDTRSYQVDFSKYERLSNNKKPIMNLEKTIIELKNKLKKVKIPKNFRNSYFMRLNVINKLINAKHLDSNLKWMI